MPYEAILLLITLAAPIIAAFVLLFNAHQKRQQSGFRPVRIWAVVFMLVLLLDPLSQVFLLEWLDRMRGISLKEQAQAAGIVGMNEEQVFELLGQPSRVRNYGSTPTWEYKQVPGYWFGSYFQVFFDSGKVYGIEPNDD